MIVTLLEFTIDVDVLDVKTSQMLENYIVDPYH